MKILVGNDWKTTAAAYSSSAATLATGLTTFLGVVAMNDPQHNWLWTILAAFVVFALLVFRVMIGQSQNYVQSDPNIGTLANPAVVTVNTTGPVPEAITTTKNPPSTPATT
jgi:predicted lysophospholipase L1 biosynthesis ABC-type transport system permease subunit